MAPLVTVDRFDTDVPAGLAIVTLCSLLAERRNALSIALRDEMSDALDALAADDDLRVVIVTGAGSVFSAGFDLDEFGRLTEPVFAAGLWASSDRWHRTVLEFPLPTVAAVNGRGLRRGIRPRGHVRPAHRLGEPRASRIRSTRSARSCTRRSTTSSAVPSPATSR